MSTRRPHPGRDRSGETLFKAGDHEAAIAQAEQLPAISRRHQHNRGGWPGAPLGDAYELRAAACRLTSRAVHHVTPGSPADRPLGWRQRAANFDGAFAFAVDYEVRHRCGLAWVDQPRTPCRGTGCGVASAGLAALRAEHPGVEW